MGFIPPALGTDRSCPLAAGDRSDPAGHVHQRIPGLAASLDDGGVVGPDAQAEMVLAQVLPDVLDGIQLGAVALPCHMLGWSLLGKGLDWRMSSAKCLSLLGLRANVAE